MANAHVSWAAPPATDQVTAILIGLSTNGAPATPLATLAGDAVTFDTPLPGPGTYVFTGAAQNAGGVGPVVSAAPIIVVPNLPGALQSFLVVLS